MITCETTYQLGKHIVHAIQKKKTIEMLVLDVHELTPLADLFIIATASNTRQTQAIADEIEEEMAEVSECLLHKEGYQSATWILLDYGEIIVHILEEQFAQFYQLDRLWQDAKKIEL